ncbi:MAG: fibronectin type III-like domain-contianing protein, partial [Eubacterium sp.]|nr:fibronectin type III-like domain-contianing protein [Eubacterium sp.]
FKQENDCFDVSVNVKNIGAVSGKEVVQLYVQAPQVKLKKAAKSLVAFAKTKDLAPNEEECISVCFKLYDISSFDEDINSYIIEKGEYIFYAGNSVKTDLVAGKAELDEQIIDQLTPVCTVKNPFKLITGEMTKTEDYSLRQRILDHMPREIGFKGDKGYKLSDVASGKITLDDFISQLDKKELEALTRGQGM